MACRVTLLPGPLLRRPTTPRLEPDEVGRRINSGDSTPNIGAIDKVDGVTNIWIEKVTV